MYNSNICYSKANCIKRLCVYVCMVCVSIYTKSYERACGCVEGRGWCQLSSLNSLHSFLRQGLSMNLEHTDLLRLCGQSVLSDFIRLMLGLQELHLHFMWGLRVWTQVSTLRDRYFNNLNSLFSPLYNIFLLKWYNQETWMIYFDSDLEEFLVNF